MPETTPEVFCVLGAAMIEKRQARLQVIGDEQIWTIPLTRGMFALIDECDIDLAVNDNWYALPKGYGCRRENGEVIRLHHVILLRLLGYEPSGEWRCVYLNGNSLDNRRFNLQLKNIRKTPKRLAGTHMRRNGRWTARIYIDGKAINLGSYATEEEANNIYLRALNEKKNSANAGSE